MAISTIGRVLAPLLLPMPNGPGAQLVEKGPQIINARLPDAVVTDSHGRPRMGLSRRPADMALKEFITATAEQAVSGTGSTIDLLG